MTHTERKRHMTPFGETLAPLEPNGEPQDYLDLDAAGFLMIALGHLVKARELLEEWPKSAGKFRARTETILATNHVRYALKRLDEHP